MPKSKSNPKVDWYFNKSTTWQKEITELRTVALNSGLTEELKWGCPCYTLDGVNIVLIHVFKDYCAYLFFKGALMKDGKKILVQQTKNVQAGRQVRFTSMDEIAKMKSTLKAYFKDAIEVEKSGMKPKFKKTAAFKMPTEFETKLNSMPPLKTAFKSMTPGRQRGYILYFSSAKQPKTREARIEKYVDRILDGLGLDD